MASALHQMGLKPQAPRRSQGPPSAPAASQPQRVSGPWTASTRHRSVTSRGSTAKRMPPLAPRLFSTMPARARSCWMERAKEYGTPLARATSRTETTPAGSVASVASMRSA